MGTLSEVVGSCRADQAASIWPTLWGNSPERERKRENPGGQRDIEEENEEVVRGVEVEEAGGGERGRVWGRGEKREDDLNASGSN